MKLLLTAFDPFGGETVNPAMEAVKLIPDRIGDIQIIKCYVPTVFNKSIAVVTQAMKEHQPDAVLCIGQAGGRSELTPERVAINVSDASIPDNEGNQPVDQVIYEDGKNAYFSSLPIKAMAAAIRAEKIPASISNSAGTFVCNHLMYGVLYEIDKRYQGVRGGFLHVPYVPSQVEDKPGMAALPLEVIVRGITASIQAIGAYEKDICMAEGKIH